MKIIVRLAAVVLAFVMCISLAACHPANEVAMKFGGVEITSAMYMYELMAADSEGRSKVDEALESGENAEETEDVDYYKQKIDGTDFTEWVRNRAEELCRIYAAEELRFAELGLETDESKVSQYEYMAELYWSYGYQTYYEKNGISLDTYKKMLSHSAKDEALFEYYYGENGTTRLSDDEMKDILSKNYIVVDEISESTSSLEDDALAELKTKLEGYKTRLEAGESFAAIKKEHSGSESSDTTDTTDETAEDDTPKPLDSDATVIMSEDAGGSDADFETIAAMEIGQVKIIENTDSKTLRLIVRKDVLADPYYYSQYFTNAAYTAKGEDYNKDMLEYGQSLEGSINSYAVNQFSPKKIYRG